LHAGLYDVAASRLETIDQNRRRSEIVTTIWRAIERKSEARENDE
jgi:hypothetical protein